MLHCIECIIDVECFMKLTSYFFSFQRFDISLKMNVVFFFVLSNKADILSFKWVVDISLSWVAVFFSVFKQLSWYFLFQIELIFSFSNELDDRYCTLRSFDIVNVKLTKKFNDRWFTSLSVNSRIIIIVWKFWNRQK